MSLKRNNLGFILFSLLGILPFLMGSIYALLYSLGVVGITNDRFTWRHWETILHDPAFTNAILHSSYVALMTIVLSTFFALWYVLQFRFTIREHWFSSLLYLPLAIPGIVASFIAVQVLARTGLFSRVTIALGITSTPKEFPNLINDNYAIGIILVFVSLVTPFFILVFNNIYSNEEIDKLSDVARSLGANPTQLIRKVKIPIILRKASAILFLYFIFIFGAYEVPLLLGKESPQMISVLIVRELRQFDVGKISEGYAVATIYTLVIIIATLCFFLITRRKRLV